jgi:hypothetical protein
MDLDPFGAQARFQNVVQRVQKINITKKLVLECLRKQLFEKEGDGIPRPILQLPCARAAPPTAVAVPKAAHI